MNDSASIDLVAETAFDFFTGFNWLFFEASFSAFLILSKFLICCSISLILDTKE